VRGEHAQRDVLAGMVWQHDLGRQQPRDGRVEGQLAPHDGIGQQEAREDLGDGADFVERVVVRHSRNVGGQPTEVRRDRAVRLNHPKGNGLQGFVCHRRGDVAREIGFRRCRYGVRGHAGEGSQEKRKTQLDRRRHRHGREQTGVHGRGRWVGEGGSSDAG